MTKSGAKKWRKQQLRAGIQQDEAEIRRFGRLLKLHKRRKTQASLPKTFKDSGLDYLLDIVGSDQEDGGVGDGSDPRNAARVAEILKECPEGAAYYEAAAEEADARKSAGAKKRVARRKKQRAEEEEAGDADQEIMNAEAAQNGDMDDTTPPVKRKTVVKRPDIYGRDAPDVLASTSATAAAVAAAAVVAGNSSTAEGTEDAELEAALRRRMRGLVNRVSERVLGRIAADLEAVYRESARGPANRILADLVLGVTANAGQLLSERILVDQAALVAVVGANVSGSELGAQLAEMLVLRLGTDMESLSASLQTGKASHNLLLFTMFLCWLGVLSARLPFDLLQSLADLATEESLEALILCLRHAGLQLRRTDGARMRALLDGLQQRRSDADLVARFGEASRGHFLLELLQAVRNNNYRKIPGYDCEYVERARKAVRQLVRSDAAPVEFGVADIRDAGVKGRWWVVGAAYAAPASVLPTVSAYTSESAPAASLPADSAAAAAAAGDPTQSRIAAIAARLGLKTPQRRAIFTALVGAADADDAAARLLRIVTSASAAAGAADVATIALKCALREARYNPFYAAVLLRLRRASRNHAMPIRCAVWDQLASLSGMRPDRAARLAELMAELMLMSALPPAAVMSRFPFEQVPAADGGGGGGGGAAACLSGFATALRRRAADSAASELPDLLHAIAADAGVVRSLAAALVVVARQRGCPDADWLLGRLRALADEA